MTAAGWHRDPSGQFDYRYWDGAAWTDAVATAGKQYRDPVPTGQQQVSVSPPPPQHTNPPPPQNVGASPLFTREALLMVQRGVKDEFVFQDFDGNMLGHMVRDPSSKKRMPRFIVTDAAGSHLAFVTTRPMFLIIDGPHGPMGRIRQTNVLTMQRLRFDISRNDQVIGHVEGKTWADETNLNITDTNGTVIGTVAKGHLTEDSVRQRVSKKHDRYALHMASGADPTVRTLATFMALFLEVIRSR